MAGYCGVLLRAAKSTLHQPSDGLLYVGSHDGKIYCLNASTGMVGYDWELHNTVSLELRYRRHDYVLFSRGYWMENST